MFVHVGHQKQTVQHVEVIGVLPVLQGVKILKADGFWRNVA